jgi:hypothetical protein
VPAVVIFQHDHASDGIFFSDELDLPGINGYPYDPIIDPDDDL